MHHKYKIFIKLLSSVFFITLSSCIKVTTKLDEVTDGKKILLESCINDDNKCQKFVDFYYPGCAYILEKQRIETFKGKFEYDINYNIINKIIYCMTEQYSHKENLLNYFRPEAAFREVPSTYGSCDPKRVINSSRTFLMPKD